MPNMLDDGFLDQAQFVTSVSNTPVNADYQLQNAVGSAISAQAILGAGSGHTCTVSVAAYSATNIQLMIQRLVNMGYTATLSGTTLTVVWP